MNVVLSGFSLVNVWEKKKKIYFFQKVFFMIHYNKFPFCSSKKHQFSFFFVSLKFIKKSLFSDGKKMFLTTKKLFLIVTKNVFFSPVKKVISKNSFFFISKKLDFLSILVEILWFVKFLRSKRFLIGQKKLFLTNQKAFFLFINLSKIFLIYCI